MSNQCTTLEDVLFLACTNGCKYMVSVLLSEFAVNPNAVGPVGGTGKFWKVRYDE